MLVYRNSGRAREREFSLEDTEWQDAEKWEWVDTRTTSEMPAMRPLVSEFALRDAEGDATEEMLTMPGACTCSVSRRSTACRVVRNGAWPGLRARREEGRTWSA